jgi:hypothetical protein
MDFEHFKISPPDLFFILIYKNINEIIYKNINEIIYKNINEIIYKKTLINFQLRPAKAI